MVIVLITGGGGFIGSHLCEYLLDKGNEVICIDNFFTGSKKNVSHLMSNTNFEIIRHDIIEPILVEVDEIYNLACPASPIHYQRNPIKTIKTSTLGITNMLGLAKRCKAKILQASTSEVYGDPTEHPQKETYTGSVKCFGPRACYDEGKRVAETFMFDYHKEHNIDIRIARIFNTYGPRMAKDDGRVISNFIIQALYDEPITVYGDGNQTRSFCYVSDMVESIYKLMNSEFREPLNLGNPHEIKIIDIANKIKELTNSNSKIVFKDLPVDDPTRRCPDISRAKEILNWEPKVGLDEGLKKTIEYFKKGICRL